MAVYKSSAGAILHPGNQINRLSGYNNEGVFAWPGVEAYEIIGYVKISNLSADKASFKSFDITVPSPDRRPDDRVRDNRTSLVVPASSDRPAYIYGASIAIGQDIPAGGLAGFPASPVTANVGGTTGEGLLLGPNNSGNPFGVPATQGNGLSCASAYISATSNAFAQGLSSPTNGGLPFTTSVTTGGIVAADFSNSMFYRVTANTTFRVFNVTAITATTVNGGGVFISQADSDAGKAGYILCRVNYLRPAAAVNWNNIQGLIDFASQQGGDDI